MQLDGGARAESSVVAAGSAGGFAFRDKVRSDFPMLRALRRSRKSDLGSQLPPRANRYRIRAYYFCDLFDNATRRGRPVSTGWRRCRWHAQDAHLAWLIT